MKTTTRLVVGGGIVVAALALGGVAVANAAGNGSDPKEVDTPITGAALVSASEAALAYTGEGTVTDTEVGDEESYYEVEVTLNDGSEVDVQLDESFAFVSSKP
jgi:hypothetical protein